MLGKANLDEFPFGDFGISTVGGTIGSAYDSTLSVAGSRICSRRASWRPTARADSKTRFGRRRPGTRCYPANQARPHTHEGGLERYGGEPGLSVRRVVPRPIVVGRTRALARVRIRADDLSPPSASIAVISS